jgi:class 3 adenylate cyclase
VIPRLCFSPFPYRAADKIRLGRIEQSLWISSPQLLDNACEIARGEKTLAYDPKPIETSKVTLSHDVLALREKLAKNAHEVWAQRRLRNGWRRGPRRDDVRKEHPCLVPYESLPESEKDYDRDASLETLKTILALGYQIEPQKASAGAPETTQEPDLRLGLGGADLGSLLAFWRAHQPDWTDHTPEVCRQIGQRFLSLGEPLLAYDVISEGLAHVPEDVSLRQLLAGALARSGATERAHELLAELVREGHHDPETMGPLARTQKDLGLWATDPARRSRYLSDARRTYEDSYSLSRGYYAGINTATLSLVLGDPEHARTLAREVRDLCLEELKQAPNEDRYWPLATLGEAALILGEWAQAEDWYRRAAALAHGRLGDLSSTRRNARLLLDHLDGDHKTIDGWLRVPSVVVFVGHMIDQPGRPVPRFPSPIEKTVHEALCERLKKLDAGIGFSSAACGSDVLFLEALRELGGEAHIVLPYERELFFEDSVDIVPGAHWGDRSRRAMEHAAEVVTVSGQKLAIGSVSYDYANQLLLGLAAACAGGLETELKPLTVWDGRPGDGPGGTASTIQRWRDLGYEVSVIRLEEILRNSCLHLLLAAPPQARSSAPASPGTAPSSAASEDEPRIMAMMFADVKGFSKLREEETPRFVEHYLGMVARLAAASSHTPVMKNTWGDGLYFVFETVEEAGEFALELCAAVKSTDWESKGLPPELSLRIGLHAGPVYPYTDPVTGRRNYIGTHVTHAARIEPVTPPNHVYASQAFAALAANLQLKSFQCEYVGRTLLAKDYGAFPTYVVRKATSGGA